MNALTVYLLRNTRFGLNQARLSSILMQMLHLGSIAQLSWLERQSHNLEVVSSILTLRKLVQLKGVDSLFFLPQRVLR